MSDESELVLFEAAEHMEKAVAATRHDFTGVRTGRATPALVEKLRVEMYGQEMTLQQLAGFSVPDARMLVIAPFDKASIGPIEKAIQHSDLGLNPSNDGNVIRLGFPTLTEERRKDLVKLVRGMAERGRTSLRNHRRSARQELEKLEKDGNLSSDELQRAEKDVDQLTKTHEDEIDAALATKEAELLEV